MSDELRERIASAVAGSDQWRRDEWEIDGGFSGNEFPRLWPPRAALECHDPTTASLCGVRRDFGEHLDEGQHVCNFWALECSGEHVCMCGFRWMS